MTAHTTKACLGANQCWDAWSCDFMADALWSERRFRTFNVIDELKPRGAGPTQNVCVERFNRTCRTEVLDCYVFDLLQEMRQMTADWLHRYNHHRPHESLGRIPPVEYRVKQFPILYFRLAQEFEGTSRKRCDGQRCHHAGGQTA